LFGVDILLRLPKGGLRSVEIRVGLQGLINQTVQRYRVEQRPPIAGDVAVGEEMLRLAAS
jgi:hypothetical protein